MNNEPKNNPELHIMEEPRNDFADTAMGFAGMFIFILLLSIIATIISYNM